MTEFGSMWCTYCQRQVKTERQPVNHTFHLLMTVLCCGLWSWIWMLDWFFGFFRAHRCTFCGNRKQQLLPLVLGGALVGVIAIMSAVIVIGCLGLGSLAVMNPSAPSGPPSDTRSPDQGCFSDSAKSISTPDSAAESTPSSETTAEIPVQFAKPAGDDKRLSEQPLGPPADQREFALPAAPEARPIRTWTDNTGSFRVEAEYISAGPAGVKLRKADGTAIVVPMDRLSPEDQAWIKSPKKRGAGPDQDRP